MEKAPVNQDELAKLYWDQGLTVAEIAKITGAGQTTVRDRLHRLKSHRAK